MSVFSSIKKEIALFSLPRQRDFGVTSAQVMLYFFSSLLMSIFEGFGYAMFLPLLDYIAKGRDIAVLERSSSLWLHLRQVFHWLGFEVSLLSLMGAILFLMALRIGSAYVKQICTHWISRDCIHHTRMNLVSAYLLSDYTFFNKQSTGRLMNVIVTETYAAVNSILARLLLLSNIAAILIYLVLMVMVSLPMTGLVLALVAVASVFTAWGTRSSKPLSSKSTEANNFLGFLFVEHLTLFRLHKLTATEQPAIKDILRTSQEAGHSGYLAKRLNALVDVIYEPVVISSILLVFFLGIEVFQAPLAGIGVFLVMLFRLMPLCKLLMSQRQSILASQASVDMVLKSLDEARAHPDAPGGEVTFSGLAKDIQFEGVSYTYPGQEAPAVDGVNLTINAGQMTAIVGPSGAGKTTLVDLLPRLRLPQRGEIRFDGASAEIFTTASLRRHIAFFSQDTQIFNDSILANISIGSSSVDEKRAWHALDRVQMGDFVRKLPQGILTVVGERGVRLSGGQKQRLALARVLVQNAPVLVLDEPTSALDSEVEKAIQDFLDLMRKESNVTMIVIAHRFSTIRNADKIVVMREGRIVQEGRHEDLVSSKNWYSMVNELQLS